MNILIHSAKHLLRILTGNAFAKGQEKQDNVMTIYTLSERNSRDRNNGKGMRLKPVSVKAQ